VTDKRQKENKQGTKQPHAELIETMLSKLELFFSSHIIPVFEKADEILFESANSAVNMDDQNRKFEFMTDLRVQKVAIVKAFITDMSLYLRPLTESRELPKKKKAKEDNQLGLIEQDEMDEMVLLTGISSKMAMNLQEELSHLEARLQHLGLQNQHIFHPEALQPKHICDAFQQALSFTEYDNKNKTMLYKLFDEEVIKQLKGLYDELNELMIEAGILPKIELMGNIKREKNRPTPSVPQPEDVVDEPYDNSSPQQGGQAYAPQGPRRAFGSGLSAAGSPAGASGGTLGGAGAQSPAGASGGVAAGTPDEGFTAGMPVGEVRQNIQNFIGGNPADSDSAVSSGGSIGGGVYYSHHDVLSALSTLQETVQASPETRLEFNASAIKKAVLSTIGEKQGGTVTKRVNQVSEKTIDFIKLIFDAIIEEESITDTIKALLLSLQIPIIKAAMLDSDFFVDDHHPARQLLDKLAEAGVGITDHSDPVYIDISKIVNTLLREFEEDIGEFTVALDALNALTEEIYEKAREKEEETHKEVQHAYARNIVLQEIRKITLGQELPRGVRSLALKVWPSLMFNHFLRYGKANDEWVELLMILAKIIDSVQPLLSQADLEELGLTREVIVSTVRSKLEKSRRPSDVVAEVIEGLEQTYETLMQTENLPAADELESEDVPAETEMEGVEPETADDQLVAEETEEVEEVEEVVEEEDTPQSIAKRKMDMLPADVQPGAWFIVYNGEDKPVRRLKLAVILIQDASLVFVDHLGNVVIEKDSEEFANELSTGLSGIIMQHSVFDHALTSALGSINSTSIKIS